MCTAHLVRNSAACRCSAGTSGVTSSKERLCRATVASHEARHPREHREGRYLPGRDRPSRCFGIQAERHSGYRTLATADKAAMTTTVHPPSTPDTETLPPSYGLDA